MGPRHWVVFAIILVCAVSESFAAPAMNARAFVRSNRENIFEGDIENLELKKGKVTSALIGFYEDLSGAVYVEINHCRNGRDYQLFKRKVSSKNSTAKPILVQKTSCQNGLASFDYDMSFADHCAKGESIEFSFNELHSRKGNSILGQVFPKISISKLETYVFLREHYKFNSGKSQQSYIGVGHAYVVLTTAFSRYLNGQKVNLDYSILRNGQARSFHQEFRLEEGNHSIDLGNAGDDLRIGDQVIVNYSLAGFKHQRSFLLTKDYTQKVSYVGNRLVYSLELNNLDWYTAEPANSVFKDFIYNRGGRSIEVSHRVPDVVGEGAYGNYELHLTLDGYQHLYINTSVLQ